MGRQARNLPRGRGTDLLKLAPALVVLTLLGCQSPPPTAPPPPVAGSPPATVDLALAEGDCTRGISLLRAALARQPDDLRLHYRLGVCATHLDASAEAVREFRWVLAHAPADSPEAQAARGWLAEAGVLAEGGAPTTEPGPRGDSALSGRAVWAESGQSPRPSKWLPLHLIGLPDSPTRGLYYTAWANEDGQFEFRGVAAGPYKLTNRLAGRPRWRLRVTLEPGRETTLTLTPDNSVEARDDVPEPASAAPGEDGPSAGG